MTLNEMLERSAAVPDLADSSRSMIREEVLAAARTDIARRAKVARLRRVRPVLIGTAAAAVAAGVVVTTALPRTTRPGTGTAASGQFTTVAQLIDAVSAATPPVDPTSGPYWKVTVETHCYPTGTLCDWTTWNGIGRDGINTVGRPGVDLNYEPQCPASLTALGGRSMPWAAVNARTWSQQDIAKLLEANTPSGHVIKSKVNGVTTLTWKPSPATPDELFQTAVGILAYDPASVTIKRQLWAAIKGMSGVTLVGQRTDARGRIGWQVSMAARPGSTGAESVLVDDLTGSVLEIASQDAGGKPAVSTIVSAGVSQSAPKPANPLAPSACTSNRVGLAVSPAS